MKLDDKKRRLIVIGIALLLILMGALQGLSVIKLDRKVSDEVSFILMMVAAWLLLSGRKFGKKAQPDQNPEPDTPEGDNAENAVTDPPKISDQTQEPNKPE